MTRSVLDNLPKCPWFLGLDLRSAAIVIATLGIVHPMAYLYTCFVYRSYLFLTVWLLTGLWSAFSVWLFVGIIQNQEMAYEAWVWFTMIFVALMVVLMVMQLVVCCLARRVLVCGAVVPAFGILYYCLTYYMVFVVNSQRMEAFPTK